MKLEIDNDGIHTNKCLYENTGFTWKTPATTISSFYKSQMDMVYTYEEKINMWIKSEVVMNPTFRSYTDFHDNTFEAIKFTIHFYDKNNVAENFRICGIEMYDFSSYNFISSQNDENINATATIKELFEYDNDSFGLLTESEVYMIFQKMDNGEIQSNISKKQFYDMMIICLGDSKEYSTIKGGLMKYLGLTSDDIDVFMREITIENANKAKDMNIEEFHNDLIQPKVHLNLEDYDLNNKFAQASVNVKATMCTDDKYDFSEQDKLEFSEIVRDYKLIEDDWGNYFSSQWFHNKNQEIQIKTKHGIQYWEYSDLKESHFFIHKLLNDHDVDHILKIWNHLFHKHSPSILCMSSQVPNLFITEDTVNIQSTIASLHKLTKGMFFKGIDIFLCPICQYEHYYLVIINLAKNEGYVIDGLNRNTEDEHKKQN